MTSISLKLFFLADQISQGKASNFCMDRTGLASSIMVNERKKKPQSFRGRPNFHLMSLASYSKLAPNPDCCCPIQRPSVLHHSDNKSLASCRRERLSWVYAIEEKSTGIKETRAHHPTICFFDVKVILV